MVVKYFEDLNMYSLFRYDQCNHLTYILYKTIAKCYFLWCNLKCL